MKSALIVEDHPVVRSMIKLVLKGEGFERIYESSRGDEVLPLIRGINRMSCCLIWAFPVWRGLR